MLRQSSWVRRARRVATTGDQVDGVVFGTCAQAHGRVDHVHRDMVPQSAATPMRSWIDTAHSSIVSTTTTTSQAVSHKCAHFS